MASVNLDRDNLLIPSTTTITIKCKQTTDSQTGRGQATAAVSFHCWGIFQRPLFGQEKGVGLHVHWSSFRQIEKFDCCCRCSSNRNYKLRPTGRNGPSIINNGHYVCETARFRPEPEAEAYNKATIQVCANQMLCNGIVSTTMELNIYCKALCMYI